MQRRLNIKQKFICMDVAYVFPYIILISITNSMDTTNPVRILYSPSILRRRLACILTRGPVVFALYVPRLVRLNRLLNHTSIKPVKPQN